MNSNTLENSPSPTVNQTIRRIPSKLLRYKIEMEVNEVRKKKVIGARCHYSTLCQKKPSEFLKHVLPKSLKEFKKVKAIKDLHFESPTRPQFVADKIEENITKKLGDFAKLQKLRIHYGNTAYITLKTFKNVVKGVKKMTDLKEFQLSLPPSHQDCDDEKLKILGKSLRRLAKLERIVLNLDKNYYITKNGFSYLTQSFRRLSSLKTLSLSLKNSGRFGDEAMLLFSQHTKKYPALENFSLIFFRDFGVHDLTLQYLNDGLKNLTNLKTVKLGFRACDRISDDGVEKLFEGLPKLERIWINFRGCDRIRDASLQSLGEKFKELKALKKLTIKFRGCDKITDQGMSGLMKGLRAMSANGGCLEDMTLIFTGCKKLTDECLLQIWHGLQEISSLKNVQVGLKSCKSLTKGTISQMVGDLKKVNPALKLTLLADSVQVWQGVCL